MSRVGKAPIPLPPGVEVSLEDSRLVVKGPKGELSRRLPAGMDGHHGGRQCRRGWTSV